MMCERCHQTAKQRCSRCLASWYCSRECQKLHWAEGHRHKCVKASRAAPVRPAGVANSSAATLRETLSDLTYCGDDNSQVRNGDRCRCPTGIIARGQLAVDPRVACRIRGWPR